MEKRTDRYLFEIRITGIIGVRIYHRWAQSSKQAGVYATRAYRQEARPRFSYATVLHTRALYIVKCMLLGEPQAEAVFADCKESAITKVALRVNRDNDPSFGSFVPITNATATLVTHRNKNDSR